MSSTYRIFRKQFIHFLTNFSAETNTCFGMLRIDIVGIDDEQVYHEDEIFVFYEAMKR